MIVLLPLNPPAVPWARGCDLQLADSGTRLREAEQLLPGHTACKWQREEWALGRLWAVVPLSPSAEQQLLRKKVCLTWHPLFQQIPRHTGRHSLEVRVQNPPRWVLR